MRSHAPLGHAPPPCMRPIYAGDGTITKRELGTVMRSLGQNPSDEELHEILHSADIDGTGCINFSEFVTLMARKIKDSLEDDKLREAFKVFDRCSLSPGAWRACMARAQHCIHRRLPSQALQAAAQPSPAGPRQASRRTEAHAVGERRGRVGHAHDDTRARTHARTHARVPTDAATASSLRRRSATSCATWGSG
jgi:hypothetical protein